MRSFKAKGLVIFKKMLFMLQELPSVGEKAKVYILRWIEERNEWEEKIEAREKITWKLLRDEII